MKVILLEDLEHLGEEGEIVDVKNGYGRNYLIPQGLARLATESAQKAIAEERRQQSRKLAKKKGDAENLAQQMAKMELEVGATVGEDERIFGTITTQQVADALELEGIEVDRRNINIEEDIRMLGVYSVAVKLHPEVTAQLKIKVVPETEAEV